MKETSRVYPIKGYLLVLRGSTDGYMGVDRNPFTLQYPSTLPDKSPTIPVWAIYSTEWERSAYKLLEENLVDDPQSDLDLIKNIEVARAIKNIIEPHLGSFDILNCKIWNVGNPSIPINTDFDDNFLGFDIAYGGGDYFSAIRSGLFTINDTFSQKYKPYLNKNGLFNDYSRVDKYLSEYRAIVSSEAKSEFVLFELQSVKS